ncbi:MAG: hypothetical protein ACOZCO_07795 [Bacteroidota bacterium]
MRSIFLFVLIFGFVVSCRKNKGLEPYPDLRDLYKEIKGTWKLTEQNSYSYSNPSGRYYSKKTEVRDGIKTIYIEDRIEQPPQTIATYDTIYSYYELTVDFYKYTMDHILKYKTVEKNQVFFQGEIIEEKDYSVNWRSAELDHVTISLNNKNLLISTGEGKLILQISYNSQSPGGTSGASDKYVFIRN